LFVAMKTTFMPNSDTTKSDTQAEFFDVVDAEFTEVADESPLL